MLRLAASLVVPPRCPLCGLPVASGERICSRCAGEIARGGPLSFRLGSLEVRCATGYGRAARRLVAQLKFSGRLPLAAAAVTAIGAVWEPAAGACLVPVPPAPARERARGFDVARLLAAGLAAGGGAPLRPLLVRCDRGRQVGRSRARRLAEPPVIRVAPGSRPPGGPLWIVDDVVTTGATLLACERALRGAGAGEVRALAFARA